MAAPDVKLEQFVTENFDSDEAVMLVVTLRQSQQPLSLSELYDRLAAEFGILGDEERRVAEKRLELRLRDLAAHGLVGSDDAGRYRYTGDAAVNELVTRVEAMLRQRPADLIRIIYSRSARARRLAEAFKL
jgi:hypothetical protein